MENASKALTMAAGVLVAIIVISLGTYIFNIFSRYSKEQTEELYSNQVMEFNAQFTKYETMNDITIYDIITLGNYANNYNRSIDNNDEKIEVKIRLESNNYANMTDIDKKNSINEKYLKKDSPEEEPQYYKVREIEYSNVTKRVKRIEFEKQ